MRAFKLMVAFVVSLFAVFAAPAYALDGSAVATQISAGSGTMDTILIALIGVVAVIWIGRKAIGLLGR